jgi:hypothetical protein
VGSRNQGPHSWRQAVRAACGTAGGCADVCGSVPACSPGPYSCGTSGNCICCPAANHVEGTFIIQTCMYPKIILCIMPCPSDKKWACVHSVATLAVCADAAGVLLLLSPAAGWAPLTLRRRLHVHMTQQHAPSEGQQHAVTSHFLTKCQPYRWGRGSSSDSRVCRCSAAPAVGPGWTGFSCSMCIIGRDKIHPSYASSSWLAAAASHSVLRVKGQE